MKVVERMLDWENAGRIDLLKTNYPLLPPELLFRKIEDTEVAAQMEKLKNNLVKSTAAKMENTTEPAKIEAAPETPAKKAEITYDDFAKIDLRVGTI